MIDDVTRNDYMNNTVLKNKHTHPRDNNIVFYPNGHKYEIATDPTGKYTSVTTQTHSYFPKFDANSIIAKMKISKSWGPDNKYWGQSDDEIKALWKCAGESSSNAGTKLHERIECFMNKELLKDKTDKKDKKDNYTHSDLLQEYNQNMNQNANQNPDESNIEWTYFLDFVQSTPLLCPYRTEWMIYDEELKLAGSIDMVYINTDGTLTIYDWKRCKEINSQNTWNKFATDPRIQHLPDTNYWHYALQLNTYRYILERNYGVKVVDLVLIRLHPDATQYEFIRVPLLDKEMKDLYK